MNRRDQVDAVAHVADITAAQAGAAIDAVVGLIRAGLLEEERIVVARLGIFSVQRRRPRRVTNPSTGIIMDLPASVAVKFRPTPELLRSVKERHA